MLAFVSQTFLARVGSMVSAVKIFVLFSLITMQNLVAVLYHMHTCRRSQKFWGAGAPLTWDGDRA